ncbi:uncharacterized protein VTP21DRAFT_9215 [Calcarisporiella thermophila]|uniref:uncharacterized protein n=1 Tax=Calcarisporiella thermophila TaxID=911321 RepID=UPI003743FBE6
MDKPGIFVAYSALGIMAVAPIYYGSLYALRKAKLPKGVKAPKPASDSEDEDVTPESLSSSDAYLFPVFGSIALFTLFLVFKYLDRYYVNLLLTAYFAVLGIASVTHVGARFIRGVTGLRLSPYKLSLVHKHKVLYASRFTELHFVAGAASLLLTVYYAWTKNWIASNVFGICFAMNAIELLSLDSFKTGIILLSGLFVYDIFWVFGTTVMVSVATNFEAPIKVVFPKDLPALIAGEAPGFTLLGLGDIVIPGIFVALCLRFDYHLAAHKDPSKAVGYRRNAGFIKPYFTSCFVAYVLGLVTTITVMHVFKAAQPALLYLSPACILAAVGTAAVRGELKELFKYTTEEEDEEAKKKAKGKKSSGKKGKKEDGDVEREHTPEPDATRSAEPQTPYNLRRRQASKEPEVEAEDEEDTPTAGDEDEGEKTAKSASKKGRKKKNGGRKKTGSPSP